MLRIKYEIHYKADEHELTVVSKASATNFSITNTSKFGAPAKPDTSSSNDSDASVISRNDETNDTSSSTSETDNSDSYTDSSFSIDSGNPLQAFESVQAGPDIIETKEKGTSGRYTIPKVQVKPGRTIDPNQDELAVNYLSRLPVLREQAAPYVPMPYVFRVNADCNRIKIQNMWGRCPPFHLLFDHTIAVIWLLFAEQEYESPLGIAQLQWALAFLNTIHTRQGDHPKDVQTCIDAIENILMEQYANLAPDMPNVTKLDETVNYVDGALGSQSMVVKSIPFSLNYAEMINRSPAAVASKDSKLSMTSAEAQEELENIKKTAGVKSMESLDSASKHRAINVLKAWKTEQLEKIRGELRRLRSIEDKMKDIDDNFEGYLEDDLEMLYVK